MSVVSWRLERPGLVVEALLGSEFGAQSWTGWTPMRGEFVAHRERSPREKPTRFGVRKRGTRLLTSAATGNGARLHFGDSGAVVGAGNLELLTGERFRSKLIDGRAMRFLSCGIGRNRCCPWQGLFDRARAGRNH